MPHMPDRSWQKPRRFLPGRLTRLAGLLLLGVWVSGAVPAGEMPGSRPENPGRRIPGGACDSRVITPARQGRSDTLHVGVVYTGDFVALPPDLQAEAVERWIAGQVYGPGLVQTFINGRSSSRRGRPGLHEPIPVLADDVSYPPAGAYGSFTFILDRGVSFQNGEELTVEHIRQTFEVYRRLSRLQVATIDPAFIYIDSTAANLETGRFSFAMAMPMIEQGLRLAASPILSPAMLRGLEPGQDPRPVLERNAADPVGLGGYRVVDHGDRLHLTAFLDYFSGRPDIRNIIIHFYPDDSALIRAFVTGEIQFARLPTWKSIARIWNEVQNSRAPEQTHLFRPYIQPDHFVYLALNNEVAPLDNPHLRRLFANMIHRELPEFRDEPFGYSAIPDVPLNRRSRLGRFVPTPTRQHQPRSYVLRQLRESGLNLTRTGYPRDENDQPFQLELIYPDAVEHYETVARQIKNDLETFQFRIEVVPLTPAEVRRRLATGEYELALSEMTLPPTVDALYRLYHSENIEFGLNVARYANPDFDSEISRALLQTGPAGDVNLESAIRWLYDEVPFLPLFFQANVYYFFDNTLVDPESLGPPLNLMRPMAEWRWR